MNGILRAKEEKNPNRGLLGLAGISKPPIFLFLKLIYKNLCYLICFFQFLLQLTPQGWVHCFWDDLIMCYFLNHIMAFLAEKDQEKENPLLTLGYWPFLWENQGAVCLLMGRGSDHLNLKCLCCTECKKIKASWDDCLWV